MTISFNIWIGFFFKFAIYKLWEKYRMDCRWMLMLSIFINFTFSLNCAKSAVMHFLGPKNDNRPMIELQIAKKLLLLDSATNWWYGEFFVSRPGGRCEILGVLMTFMAYYSYNLEILGVYTIIFLISWNIGDAIAPPVPPALFSVY